MKDLAVGTSVLVVIGCLIGLVFGANLEGDAYKYFYVKSSSQGYSVNINTCDGTKTRIGKYTSLKDAEKLCDQLNKDIEGYQIDPAKGNN